MLDKDRVYSQFLLYANLDGESPRLRALCNAAAESLVPRLKGDIDAARHMERLCACAAGLAYCDYCELSAVTDTQELRVGEVTLRSSAASAVSTRELDVLREHFLTDIADLLCPPFVFGQVQA